MNAVETTPLLAKLTWDDPQTGQTMELTLPEGSSVTIGRQEGNEIVIKEQHVSRQHATIKYYEGMFVISDLGSANGVFVNNQRLTTAYPLVAGDEIRLYVPVLQFSALVGDAAVNADVQTGSTGKVIAVITGPRLVLTAGAQVGSAFALDKPSNTIGRVTSKAEWDICLEDHSVSRPHARIDRVDNNWVLYDLGSANGTLLNGTAVTEKGRVLRDGDVIGVGGTVAEFHSA